MTDLAGTLNALDERKEAAGLDLDADHMTVGVVDVDVMRKVLMGLDLDPAELREVAISMLATLTADGQVNVGMADEDGELGVFAAPEVWGLVVTESIILGALHVQRSRER